MKPLLRILIVEDSDDDALLILSQIKKGGYAIEFERVDTVSAMTKALNGKSWDIVLSDYSMPYFNGLEALKLLKESNIDIPFIIISGKIGEELAVEALKNGAHDYIMKGNLNRLLLAVERELRESKERAEKILLEQKQLQIEEELRKSEMRLNEFNKLQSLLLNPSPIEQKLNLVTDAVVQIMGADFARIWMIKPGDRCETGCIHAQVTENPHICKFRNRCLHLMASSGRYTHTNGQVHARVPFGCYKIGKVAAAEDSKFLTNEVTTDPRVHNNTWAKELGLVSFAGYRLVDPDGVPLGVMALFSKQTISVEDDSFLEGIALSTSRVLHSAWSEAALLESEARYHLLFEKSADGILIVDVETQMFKYANPALCRMLQYTVEELTKLGLADIHPKQDLLRVIAEFESQARGEKMLAPDIPCLRKDGSIIYADINTTTTSIDSRACAVGLFRDITERRQAAETLKSSLERSHRQQAVVNAIAVSPQLAAGNVQALAHQLNEIAAKAVDIERVSVWLFNVEGNALECIDIYENSQDRHSAGAVLLRNEYKNEFEALLTAKYIDANDPLTDPRTAGYVEGYLKPLKITSMLDAVIREGNRNIGVLCFEHVGKKHDWEPDEITFATQLADQLAIAALNRERILAEGLLKSSEEQYRTLFENIPIGIGVSDLTGKLIAFNDAMLIPGGYSRDDIIRIGNVENLYYNLSDREAVISLMKKEGFVNQNPIKFKRKDGSAYDTLLSLSIIHFKDQPRIQALVEDITERKRTEEALSESKNLLQNIIDNSPSLIYILDLEGKFILANKRLTKVLNSSAEKLLGNTRQPFMSKEFADQHRNNDLQIINTKQAAVYEEEIMEPDGHHTYLTQKFPLFDSECKIYAVGGISTDITRRKQVEEALLNSERRYRLLIDTVNEGILVAQNGLLKFVNPMMQVITGFTHDELLTLPFINYVHPDDREIVISNHMKRLRGEQFLPRYQFRILKKDGSIRRIEMNGIVIEWLGQPATLNMLTDITERKQTEEALQHERTLLRLLIDNVPDLMYTKDRAGCKTLVNLADVQNMGAQSEDEVLGKDDFAFFQREMAEKFYADDQSVMQTGVPLINKEEYTLNDLGQEKWFLTSKFPLKDKSGQIIGLAGIGRDITERKYAEEAIFKSKEQYRLLVESAPDIIFIIASNGKLTSLSPAFETLLAWQPEEWIGKHFAALIHPDDRLRLLGIFQQAIQGMLPPVFESRVLTKKGHYLFFEYIIKQIRENDEIRGVMGIARHITERKKAEEKINMLAHAIKNSADCIAITDKDYKIIFVNDSFCKVYGFENEEVVGQPITVITSKNNLPEVGHSLYSAMANKEVWTGEVLNKRKDGNDFPVLLSLAPVIDDKGELIAIVGVLRDITERRRAEAEIKLKNEQLQKLNAEKDKFFSIIAHDLKSPLNSIVGFSDLLSTNVKEKNFDDVEKYSEIIGRSTNRAMDLLMNLMEWSQSQTGRMIFKPEYFELSALVNEIVLLFADIAGQKSIHITKELFYNVPVYVDKAMISTVLRNLVSNAIKFTKPNGNIIISTMEKNNELVVSVHDNGVGIPESAINKLFRIDENYSTPGTQNEKGTGLGLVLCKEFIEKHGGKIWVESQEGKGTTFYFTLP